MKASGTATARRAGTGKPAPAKTQGARAQAKSVPAAVKKEAKTAAMQPVSAAGASKAPSVKKTAPPPPKSKETRGAAPSAKAGAGVAPSHKAAPPPAPPRTQVHATPAKQAAKPAPDPAQSAKHAQPPPSKPAPAPAAANRVTGGANIRAPVAAVAEASPPPRPAPDAVRRAGGLPGVPPGPITPPRAPAKPEIFREGDHVVYPTHGVGKVERIATEEIVGHKLELIHITFEENRMTLRVPVAKARSAGLRKLATRKLFEEALGVLKGKAKIKRTMWSRRAQEYEAKINSGDPLAIAEVVRDLHRNSGQPDQSFSERQIYEAAMDRLAAELAALDKTDKSTAATKLTDFLKTV